MHSATRYTLATVAGAVTGFIGGIAATYAWGAYAVDIGHLNDQFGYPYQSYARAYSQQEAFMLGVFGHFLMLGILTGLIACLDKAGLPRIALIVGYFLLALIVLRVNLSLVFEVWHSVPSQFINLVPLCIWSLALVWRAVYLIHRGG